MDSLIYSLNATVPVFLTMLLGYVFRRMGMLNESFVNSSNKFNFKVTLPVLLFTDLAGTDIRNNFDVRYVLFCALTTVVMFFVIWAGARKFLKEKESVGAFVQASYRSSAAVLGVAFIQNIYGNPGLAPIMIIGCVPLFNIFAVTVLTIEGHNGGSGSKTAGRVLLNIAKNPIIIGILLGVAVSFFNIHFPPIINKTLNNFSVMATPLALVAIGAGFEGKKALSKIRPTVAASLIKLVVLPLVFVPTAILMGFRDQALVALIIMLGSPSTPTCYIMAKNMNNDAVLSSSIIVATTVASSLTLTFWIFLARAMGVIA